LLICDLSMPGTNGLSQNHRLDHARRSAHC
jgi:hypothetical protein